MPRAVKQAPPMAARCRKGGPARSLNTGPAQTSAQRPQNVHARSAKLRTGSPSRPGERIACRDRPRGVSGKSVSVRVDLGGRPINQKNTYHNSDTMRDTHETQLLTT